MSMLDVVAVTVREPLPWPVPLGWFEWVTDIADTEKINPADVLVRALQHEKHRLGGARPDERTRRNGERGMRARLPVGMMTSTDLAELIGTTSPQITRIMDEHMIAPSVREGTRGSPVGWTLDEAKAFACAWDLVAAGARWDEGARIYKQLKDGTEVDLNDGNIFAFVARSTATGLFTGLAKRLPDDGVDSVVGVRTAAAVAPFKQIRMVA